jgi:hypothetical protein
LPCTYLGLPLHFRNPRKVDYQAYIDKVAGRLKPWKGKHLNRKGRLTLINSVLTSTLTYFLMVFDPPSWFIKKIDRITRNFLWAGDEIASGAKCMVNWKQICAPKDVGGLGIKNLKLFSRALRLCWNWLSWTDTSKPWKGLPHHSHPEDKALFQACTDI